MPNHYAYADGNANENTYTHAKLLQHGDAYSHGHSYADSYRDSYAYADSH